MAKWLQKATDKMEAKGTKGLFKRAAERAGMSTEEFAAKEKNSPDPKMRKRATFAENASKASK
jgi:hypothetical protein